MSATPGKLLAQAKQGDPKAIAALMNRSTQSKGISVKASLKERCLQVLFEGNVVPHQDKTMEFVREGMAKLQVEAVDRVKVYGRQVGQETPVWQDEMILASSNPFDEETDDLDSGMEEYDDPSAISDTDFPEPPVGADSFLDEDEPGFDEAMDENYEEDFPEEDYEGQEAGDEDSAGAEASSQQKKPGVTVAAVLAVLLLLILGGGYYVYSSRPELLRALPFFEVDDEGNVEFTPSMEEESGDTGTDGESGEETTAPEAEETAPSEAQNQAPVDPFSLAVSAAIEASEKTQSAQSPQEWQEIAELWETAIAQMEAVPEDHPQYDVAQDRAESYQTNLQYAQQQAQ
ncbi:MAG: hypothetical protein ACLFM4_09145 [Phormidium sp.]|nr:MAG: hypothetical protein HLUCCO16_10800 [Phormidium sp. OSCR]